MTFKLILDPRVEKELNKLSVRDRSKIAEYTDLFEEYGFALNQNYLKKVDKYIWELRPNKWRLFIISIKPDYIVIHMMYKQSQKMTKETKSILYQRTKEYL